MPLDPEAAAWLEREREMPSRGSLTVNETRAAYLKASALMADPVPVVRVEDVFITSALRGRDYWPSTPDATLSILVWLHGGRFFSGNLETHDALCRVLAVTGRCRILAVAYRLAPECPFPAAVEDSLAAIDWAQAQSSRVGVGGDSAGGNLAAVAALLHTRTKAHPLRLQLLVYPMMDPACSLPSHREFENSYGPSSADMQRGWREYLPQGVNLHDERVSPHFAENLAGLPPTLVMTAEYDCLRDEGEAYARRLASDGVNVSMRRYDGAIHGFFQMPKIMRLAREAIGDAGGFLQSHL